MNLTNFININDKFDKYPYYLKQFKKIRKKWGITKNFIKMN